MHSPHFLPSANDIFWATDRSHHWKFFIKTLSHPLGQCVMAFSAPTVDECGMWLNSGLWNINRSFDTIYGPRLVNGTRDQGLLSCLPFFWRKIIQKPKGAGDTVRAKESQLLNHQWGNIMLTSNACLNYQDTKKSFSKYYVFWGDFVISAVLIVVITL